MEARRPRLTEAEKAVVKGGGTPEGWKPARTRQVDRHGRWTLKRGRKRPTPPERGAKRIATGEILVPAFGYKNHLSIDRQFGPIRRFAVSHAAAHDGGQLGAVLDPTNTASQVWAGEPVSATGPSEPANAYRSKANLALLERRGLSAELQRPKPRGRPMPTHIRGANAARATVRSAVEHVFAAQKRRTGLVIRTIGIARARAKLALANIAYNLSRLVWLAHLIPTERGPEHIERKDLARQLPSR